MLQRTQEKAGESKQELRHSWGEGDISLKTMAITLQVTRCVTSGRFPSKALTGEGICCSSIERRLDLLSLLSQESRGSSPHTIICSAYC